MAGFGPVQFQANKRFIDPYPLSLELVLTGSSNNEHSLFDPSDSASKNDCSQLKTEDYFDEDD